MAFDIEEDFKEVGAPNNTDRGGQTYSVFSQDDSLGDMLVSGYLDALASTLNVGDTIILSGTDSNGIARVDSITTSGVVSLLSTTNSTIVITAAGALSVDAALNELQVSGGGSITLPDGYLGQQLGIVMVTDSGDVNLTLDTALVGGTYTFSLVGNALILVMTSAGWGVMSNEGVSTS